MAQVDDTGTDIELPSLVFTTDNMRPRDRLDAWNAAFGRLNEIHVEPDGGSVPTVRSENWVLSGGIVLSENSIHGARFVRDAQRTRRDQFDHWVLRVVRKGHGHLVHPRFETTTGPGDVVLFPASDTWSCDWHDVEWVTICIPRDMDLRLTARLASVPPGRLNLAGAGLLSDLILALPGRVSRARINEVPSLTGMVLAAVSACLPENTDGAAPAEAGAVLTKERVRRAIIANIGSSRLTPAFLASSVGVSRSVLYRIFEPEGGVSRFIRNTRLSLAYAALQSPAMAHKSIALIAEDHGFPDPPEFSRAFRSAFGKSPREVRSSALTGTAIAPLPASMAPLPTGASDIASRIYAPQARLGAPASASQLRIGETVRR